MCLEVGKGACVFEEPERVDWVAVSACGSESVPGGEGDAAGVKFDGDARIMAFF